MRDQIVITVATGLTVLLEACHFPPSAKGGPFSRWAPLSSMKGLLITHMGDFLPPACCCAKHDLFTSHSESTCFTCQLCLQPENSLLLIFAAWLEWNLSCCLHFCCSAVVAGNSKSTWGQTAEANTRHHDPQHIHPISQPLTLTHSFPPLPLRHEF